MVKEKKEPQSIDDKPRTLYIFTHGKEIPYFHVRVHFDYKGELYEEVKKITKI